MNITLAQLFVGDVVVADEGDAPHADRLCSVILNMTLTSLSFCGTTSLVDLGEEVALLGVLVADLLDAAADRRVAEDACSP